MKIYLKRLQVKVLYVLFSEQHTSTTYGHSIQLVSGFTRPWLRGARRWAHASNCTANLCPPFCLSGMVVCQTTRSTPIRRMRCGPKPVSPLAVHRGIHAPTPSSSMFSASFLPVSVVSEISLLDARVVGERFEKGESVFREVWYFEKRGDLVAA